MKKIMLPCLAALALAACSTVPPAENLTMQEATLNLSSLKRDEYIILGRITGEAEVTVSSASLKKDIKKAEQRSDEPTIFSTVLTGDTRTYGFIGDAPKSNMTVTEKVTALATYDLLTTAKYNDADAVLYVTRQVSIAEKGSKSLVTAKVSGVAIKLKADEGVEIVYPLLRTAVTESDAPATTESESTEQDAANESTATAE